MNRYTVLPIPWGSLILACDDRGPSRVILTRRRRSEAIRLAVRELPSAEYAAHLLPDLEDELEDYFKGRPVVFHATPDLTGLTPFRQRVLRACAKIPYGKTSTYAELAERVGHPGAARAVGSAMAGNPVPIIIPCHRVITSQGKLGGFSAEHGVALKRELLEMEARAIS